MTHLDKLISQRRSIRKFKPYAPPEDWIKKMITAGGKAPSPSNRQPVRFFRIASSEIRKRLYLALQEGREFLLAEISGMEREKRLKNWINTYYRYSEFMFDAPVLFAVGTSLKHLTFFERIKSTGIRQKEFSVQRDMDISVGLSLMGYILKGEDLGLGSCILTAPLIFIEEPEKILSLEQILIRCFLTTGYADEEPAYIQRKNIDEIYKEI